MTRWCRAFAVLACVLVSAISQALAGDKLVIFSDAALTDSTLADTGPRIVNLYVVNTGHDGSVGVRFATVASPGFGGVWLGDSSSFSIIGESPTDIGVGYGACLPAPILVLTMQYQFFGTSAACSELRIGKPGVFTHSVCLSDLCFEGVPCEEGALHVNCALPVESSTWGSVKALYR